MHYAHILTARITRTIIDMLHELGRNLPDYGDVSAKAVQIYVSELLHPDSILPDRLEDLYNELTGRFGCALSVEEALILGTGGFNACPMEQFDRGEASLEQAIELCFDQTFTDVLSEEFQVGAAKETPEEPGLKLVKN
jgi:hypothetical protein